MTLGWKRWGPSGPRIPILCEAVKQATLSGMLSRVRILAEMKPTASAFRGSTGNGRRILPVGKACTPALGEGAYNELNTNFSDS